MGESENINIYEIYVKLILDDDEKLRMLREMLRENNEDNLQEHLFFGKKPKYLSSVVPFKWEGVYQIEKKDDKQVLCHSLLFDFIEVLIMKFHGIIEDNTLLKSNIDIETLSKHSSTIKNNNIVACKETGENAFFQLIDIEWEKWEDNYPSGIDSDTILRWLLIGVEENKNKAPFGEKFAYEKLGLWKENKLVNLSTLHKCFLSCSSKRILIIRFHSNDVQENAITVPSLETACWAAIGLMGANFLLNRLTDIEGELWKLFEETAKKDTDNEKENILEKTSKALRDLGVVFRRASQIQKFYSGYPISSPVAGLIMETFSRLTGSKGMIKTLGEKLENAYRLYQLYQQYYYFKEMEKLEPRQKIS